MAFKFKFKRWHLIAILLSFIGICQSFRPSSPYLTEYLIYEKGFSKETISQDLFPIVAYVYLGTLPLVVLLTDIFRYKAVIILQSSCLVTTYALLVWGEGLTVFMVAEVFFGLSRSTEIAYFTYIYTQVGKSTYKKVTSYTYSATFIGNFLAGVIGQALVSSKWMTFRQLHITTVVSVSCSLILALFLPNSENSEEDPVFEDETAAKSDKTETDSGIDSDSISTYQDNKNPTETNLCEKFKNKSLKFWQDCKSSYSNPHVLKWCVWWALASAGYIQASSYIQPLWKEISGEAPLQFNGVVDAAHTLSSTVFATIIGHISFPWKTYAELSLLSVSLAQGSILIWMSQTAHVTEAYVGFVLFKTLYQVMMTVACSEVAQGVSEDSYHVIFGINRFVALVGQVLLTFTFSDDEGFALGERVQFVVYGGFHGILGGIFGVALIFRLAKYFYKKEKPEVCTVYSINIDFNNNQDKLKSVKEVNLVMDNKNNLNN